MSARVDVLAAVDEYGGVISAQIGARQISHRVPREIAELIIQRDAAVAELIEADKALDAIDAELPCAPEDMPDPMAYLRRREAAVARRAAALARIGGAA